MSSTSPGLLFDANSNDDSILDKVFIDDGGDSTIDDIVEKDAKGNDKYSFVVDDDDEYDVPEDLKKSPTTNPTSYTISQHAFGTNLDDDNIYNDDSNGN
eukprot:1264566-Ditylum_brightwellii.AAC.1